MLNVTIGDQQFCIINVYAPNDIKDRKDFFNSLDCHLAGRKQFILTGDFNCVENLSLDKIGGDPQSGDKGAEILKNIGSSFDLVDAFCSKYPKKQEFTYISKSNNVWTRLGRFYVSRNLVPVIEDIVTAPNPYSDHAMVSLIFKDFDADSFSYGPGYWKCNVKVLESPDFIAEFEELWIEIFNVMVKDGVWWESSKARFKELIIKHSHRLSAKYFREVKEVEKKLRHFHILNHQNPGEFENVIDSLNTTLKELIRNHLAGAKIRAKVNHLENDDQPTRFFLCKEVAKGKKKLLKELHMEGGKVTRLDEIMHACRDFYKSLYSSEEIDPVIKEEFLADLPKLSEEESKSCEGILTYDECYAAVKQMKKGKCPGSDGLPKEFYVKFFPLIGKAFVEMVNCCFDAGMLTESQRYGLISLLCKKPEASQFLTNWRPISLLNVDYKIISKSLCNRLRVVMGSIVSIDQTCSVPKRSILDNCHLLRCIADYAEQKNVPVAVINPDQAKTFDRVSHEFLFDCLKAYGFGPDFL